MDGQIVTTGDAGNAGRLGPRRRIVVVAACATACVLLAATAAFGFDRRTQDVLLPGTTVGGVAVGGLGFADAVSRLRERVEDPLRLPIRIRAAGVETTMSAWDLGMRVQVRDATRAALRAGRQGGLFQRIWRRLRAGGAREFALRPTLDRARLRSFLTETASKVFVPTSDGAMDAADGWVRLRPGRTGRQLDLQASERALREAIGRRAETVDLPVREVAPKVPTSAFETVVLVRLGENKLYLYREGVIVKTYSVASGASEFPTPVGTFSIVRKRVNPKWVNPGSQWAKKLPSFLPPGPDNPLGSRAMDINVSGIRIHGTPDAGSIGYSVSHGCVRMTMADAEDLFERVSVGTPVVIFRAGPPKPRPAAKPAPAPSPNPA